MKKILFYIFSTSCIVLYIVAHIYFTYMAFTTMKLWFAILIFLAPIAGDLLFIGAEIYNGNFFPLIFLSVIGILYFISTSLAETSTK